MVNRTATRQTTHHMDTVFIGKGLVNLLNGVLVLADDDGWLIDPENKNLIQRRQLTKSVSFKGDIISRVMTVINDIFHKNALFLKGCGMFFQHLTAFIIA